MDTREKSARLTSQQAEALFPGLLEKQTPQTRTHWKSRGVPWDVIGPLVLAQSRKHAIESGPVRATVPDATAILGIERADMDREDRAAWDNFIALLKAAHRRHLHGDLLEEWEMIRRRVALTHRQLLRSGRTRTRKTKDVTQG